jgi:hypothetical protein
MYQKNCQIFILSWQRKEKICCHGYSRRLKRRKRGQSHALECMVDAVHCTDLARRRSGLLSDMNYQKNSLESGLAFSCGEMGSSSGFILRYWHTTSPDWKIPLARETVFLLEDDDDVKILVCKGQSIFFTLISNWRVGRL